MKAHSKKHRLDAQTALYAKRGERSKASLKEDAKQMEKTMSEEELGDMASPKRKDLPETEER